MKNQQKHSGLSTTQKVLYIGVFYILYGMGVTALTMPQMVLAASGYIANAIGQEPESAMIAINSLRFALPAATCVILIVCLIFNPVEPHRAEINKMKESMKAIDE